jgi:hypothetical protein
MPTETLWLNQLSLDKKFADQVEKIVKAPDPREITPVEAFERAVQRQFPVEKSSPTKKSKPR